MSTWQKNSVEKLKPTVFQDLQGGYVKRAWTIAISDKDRFSHVLVHLDINRNFLGALLGRK